MNEIDKVWLRDEFERRENKEYVSKVIVSEAFIKFYMDTFNVSKMEAQIMINKTPFHKRDRLKDMELSDKSESDDSE